MHPGTFGIRNKQEVLVTGLSVLKQAEVGVPVAELIRQTEITEQKYYPCKAKYAGLEVDQMSQHRNNGLSTQRDFRFISVLLNKDRYASKMSSLFPRFELKLAIGYDEETYAPATGACLACGEYLPSPPPSIKQRRSSPTPARYCRRSWKRRGARRAR